MPTGARESELKLATVENDAWVELITTVDQQNNKASAEISHLSVYGIIWDDEPNTVGPEGGTVTSDDQNVTLEVPQGALSGDITFSIGSTTDHPGGSTVGTAYEIGPSGTAFANAATLTFRYQEILAPGDDESDVRVATVENNEWIALNTTVDAQNNTVGAKIGHLSIFGMILVPEPAPSSGWGTPEQLSDPDALPFVFTIDDFENPEVAIDQNGNALAVWLDDGTEELWWSRYDAAGDSWTVPLAVNGSAGARSFGFDMNSGGEAAITWHYFESGSNNNRVMASIYTPGMGWGAATSVDGLISSSSLPDISIDGNGNATAIWEVAIQDPNNSSVKRKKAIYANRYNPSSGWGLPLTVDSWDYTNTFSGVNRGEVEALPNGDAMAIWKSYNGSDIYSVWAAVISDSGLEGSEAVASSSQFIAAFPELSIDGSGNGLIVWRLNTAGGTSELHAAEYDATSGLFGTPVTVAQVQTSPGSDLPMNLASDTDGTAMLVWRGFDGNYNSVYSSLFTPGIGWSSPALAEMIDMDEGTSWDGDEFRPKVSVLSDGRFLAGWHFRGELSRAAAYANTFTQQDGWGTPVLVQDYLVDGSEEYAAWPYPAAGPNGEALIIWAQGKDNMPGDVWLSRYTTSN